MRILRPSTTKTCGQLRAKQVRSAHLAAAEIGTVAQTAVHAIQAVAARDGRGIGKRALLCGKGRLRITALTTGTAGPLPSGTPLSTWRRLLGTEHHDRSKHRARGEQD